MADKFYKIRFTNGKESTAGLVVKKSLIENMTISDMSRLFPHFEATKMKRLQQSPQMSSFDEAFYYDFDDKGIKKNPAPKRKTAARSQRAAVGYVNRPSQITKKAPTKRLKKRRTINLQTPRGVFPNPSPREVDEAYAREIFLYGQNDGDLYRQQTTYIIDNLAKKYAKGQYDHALGRKAWRYWADNATKKYGAEFIGQKTGFIVNVPTRNLIAELAENYYFDHVTQESAKFAPGKTLRKNPVSRHKKAAQYYVEADIRGAWKHLAYFPPTVAGKKDAVEYGKAYANAHNVPVRISQGYFE